MIIVMENEGCIGQIVGKVVKCFICWSIQWKFLKKVTRVRN